MALFGSGSRITASGRTPEEQAEADARVAAEKAMYPFGRPQMVETEGAPHVFNTGPWESAIMGGALTGLENKIYSGQQLTPDEQALMPALAGSGAGDLLETYKGIQDPTYGMTPEQAAAYGKNQALEDRFSGYYSFFDPAFQMTPTLLGQSARSLAGPSQASQLAQYGGLGMAQNFANTNLQFMSPDQQQALANQWAQVQAGQGAPDFSQAGARQQEQYGNLGAIIAGGGADAIELARRQAQRADSEAWLRGQREADMADYAERGLTGSGMELQTLAMDRQAAAQRNSLGDAQMAAELEKRKMDAINAAAGLAGQMRTAEFGEKGYLDQRALNALNEQTDLASLMRNQQAAESVANRSAQQAGLNTYADLASKIRESEAGESQFRATGADDFAKWNANTLNAVNDSYTSFLRDSQQQAQQLQQQWAAQKLATGVNVAQTMANFDQRETQYGFGQGTNLAYSDAATKNAADEAYRKLMTAGFTGGTAADLSGTLARNELIPKTTGYVGAVGDEIAKWWSGYGAMDTSSPGGTSQLPTGGSGGASNASLAGSFNDNPDAVQGGSASADDWFKKVGIGGGY